MDDNITDGQDDKPSVPNKIRLQLKKRSDNSSLNNSVDSTKKESSIKLSINSKLVKKESISSPKKPAPEISNEPITKKNVNQTIKLDLDIPKAEKTQPKIKLILNTPDKEVIEDIQIIDDGIPPVQLEKKSAKVALSFAQPERKVKKNISDTIKLKMSPDSKLPSFSEAFDSMESSNDIQTDESPVIQELQSIQADDELMPNLNQKSNKKATKVYIIIALIILLVLIYYVYTSLGAFLSL